jgi:PKD repeat protein
MDAQRTFPPATPGRSAVLLGLLALTLLVPTGVSAHPTPVSPSVPVHASLPVLAAPERPAATPDAGSNWWNLTSLSSAVPEPRALAQSTWDAGDGYTLMFGGTELFANFSADTWSYSNGTWTQLFPSVSPSPRAFGEMAYDAADGYVVLFGGFNGSAALGDTWTYARGVWTNITPLSSPEARYGAVMAYDPDTGSLILYGGVNSSDDALGDTWSFSHGTWTELSPAAHPPPLVAATLTYDAADGYLLMFGGSLNGTDYGETSQTWNFHGGTWSQLTPAVHPPAELGGVSTYDAATQTVLLLGGADTLNGALGDFWSFHGGAWTEISATTPVGNRYGSLFLWQPNAGYVLLADGVFQAVTDTSPEIVVADSWAYALALTASASATPVTVDVGRTVHFHSFLMGGVAPFNLSWKFGDGQNATGSAPTHNFALAGNYTVRLNVTDGVGEVYATSLVVSVNDLPAVAIGVPLPAHGSTSLRTGQSYSFFAHGSGGTPPYTYSWKFGDGGTATGNQTSHTYATAGNYTVSVEVTDADGVTANGTAPLMLEASGSGPSSGNASTTPSSSFLLYAIVAVVIVAAAGIAGWAVLRRRRSPPPATAPTSAPPPGWMAPPPGASAAAPPPPPPPAAPPPAG